MKPYSLKFISEELEKKYSQYNKESHIGVFRRNLLIFSIIAFCVGIYSFILGEWGLGAFCFSYPIVILPPVYLFANKSSFHFDIVCFVFQASLVLSLLGLYVLNFIVPPIMDVAQFMNGQAITYLVQGFYMGSRFQFNIIVYMINILALIMIKVIYTHEVTVTIVLWIGSNFIFLHYIYWQDRIKKEAFLNKHNEKIWQKEIGSCAQICIMSFSSGKGDLQLDFQKCNKKSQQQFQIGDYDSLKKFLNNFKLISKGSQKLTKLHDLYYKSKQTNFTNLHTQIHRISQKNQSTNFDFYGFYNDNSIYNIRIFTTWNDDQLLNIHVLMTQSLNESDGEIAQRLQFERKLFNGYRLQSANFIKKTFIKLNQLNIKQVLSRINAQVMSDLHNALRINHNIQLFFNPQYKQNYSRFLLRPLIRQISDIVINHMPKHFKLEIQCCIDPGQLLHSCQKTVFQIILNLLFLISQQAKKSGYINLIARHRMNLNRSCLIFRIETDTLSILQLIDITQQQNDIYKKKSFVSHNQKFGLEMIISEYLVGQIGPHRRISFTESYQDKPIIQFQIYQDIKDMIK